jgi:hypothetical protein
MESTVESTTHQKEAALSDRALLSDEDRERVTDVLKAEYSLLTSMLSTTWSASLTRTSIFLFTLSSAGIALGFAAQAGIDRGPFRTLALVVLPIVLFLGVATFVRLVQLQRESIVYVMGVNRIRYFLQQTAPASRPFFILPPYDDPAAIYRSPGTGMSRRPPSSALGHLIVQTQGVVGVVAAAVAAAFAGLAAAETGVVTAGALAAAAFLVTLVALLTYWRRALAELTRSIRPINPIPSDMLDAPF